MRRKSKANSLRRIEESKSPDNQRVDKNINQFINKYFKKLDLDKSGEDLRRIYKRKPKKVPYVFEDLNKFMSHCTFYEKDVETEEILKKIKINMDDQSNEVGNQLGIFS